MLPDVPVTMETTGRIHINCCVSSLDGDYQPERFCPSSATINLQHIGEQAEAMFGVGYVQILSSPAAISGWFDWKTSVCVWVQEGEQRPGGGRWRWPYVPTGSGPPHHARVRSSGVRSIAAALQALQSETGSAAHLQTGKIKHRRLRAITQNPTCVPYGSYFSK